MKILFLCSSIEPKKDGVGDYTRLICSALIKKGYSVSILALNDQYVTGFVKETVISEDFSFNTNRISVGISQSQKFALTQEIVSTFNPDWVSLQFVPYGYNTKGLPFWLPNFLNKLIGKHSWHIMFHELWIGRIQNMSLKNKVISYMQEVIVRQLMKKIKPQVIHTHLPVYMNNLKKITSNISPLPLFSNISPPINFSQSIADKRFRWAFFSQVDTSPEIINFINVFNVELLEKGISPELIIIGNNKNKMLGYVEEFKAKCPLFAHIACTGFLSENEISIELKYCNLGITPVPLHGIGKSGSVAAFLAHGIPVAVPIVMREYSNDGIGFFDKNWKGAIITNPSVNEIQNAKIIAQTYKDSFTVNNICELFIKDLI
jgi:glycosyltransferase involved in cell wall biosynthesis